MKPTKTAKTKSRKRLSGWIAALVLAACVPASPPPQLAHTPGAPVVVTNERLYTQYFSVVRPAGWRVTTSAANVPLAVTFVAPEGDALMIVTNLLWDEPTPEVAPDVTLRRRTEQFTRNGVTLTAYLVAPAAKWDAMTDRFEQVIDSIEADASPAESRN
jgi:hypothetical protein